MPELSRLKAFLQHPYLSPIVDPVKIIGKMAYKPLKGPVSLIKDLGRGMATLHKENPKLLLPERFAKATLASDWDKNPFITPGLVFGSAAALVGMVALIAPGSTVSAFTIGLMIAQPVLLPVVLLPVAASAVCAAFGAVTLAPFACLRGIGKALHHGKGVPSGPQTAQSTAKTAASTGNPNGTLAFLSGIPTAAEDIIRNMDGMPEQDRRDVMRELSQKYRADFTAVAESLVREEAEKAATQRGATTAPVQLPKRLQIPSAKRGA